MHTHISRFIRKRSMYMSMYMYVYICVYVYVSGNAYMYVIVCASGLRVQGIIHRISS